MSYVKNWQKDNGTGDLTTANLKASNTNSITANSGGIMCTGAAAATTATH